MLSFSDAILHRLEPDPLRWIERNLEFRAGICNECLGGSPPAMNGRLGVEGSIILPLCHPVLGHFNDLLSCQVLDEEVSDMRENVKSEVIRVRLDHHWSVNRRAPYDPTLREVGVGSLLGWPSAALQLRL